MESPGERVVSVDVASGGVLELSSGATAMTFSQLSLERAGGFLECREQLLGEVSGLWRAKVGE
jgi:hypothetical protein